ncbi:MAG: DUF5615 family PIN-like protein [Oceanicaulis sp.]
MIRFYADECADRRVVRALRALGYDVAQVQSDALGRPDESALAQSNAERRVLITADKDFGALIFDRGLDAIGVFLLRSVDPDRCVSAILENLSEVQGAIAVISDRGVRLRPLREPNP